MRTPECTVPISTLTLSHCTSYFSKKSINPENNVGEFVTNERYGSVKAVTLTSQRQIVDNHRYRGMPQLNKSNTMLAV
jgi:hypothetical protein